MTMRMTSGVSALALVGLMTSDVLAQSGSMAKPTARAKEKSYAGCLATGSMAGSFVLNHAVEETSTAAGTMRKDAMEKDAMGKGTMGKDTMAKPAMDHTLTIASTSVDLAAHVGHRVSVTLAESAMAKPDAMGKDAMAKPDTMAKPDAMAKPGAMAAPATTMNVSSLRMLATTCGA